MLVVIVPALAVLNLLIVVSFPVILYLKNPEKYQSRGWFFNLMADVGEKLTR